jgi:type IV secretory pathway VirB3-like protein
MYVMYVMYVCNICIMLCMYVIMYVCNVCMYVCVCVALLLVSVELRDPLLFQVWLAVCQPSTDLAVSHYWKNTD